jgi:predicted outer membrane protein
MRLNSLMSMRACVSGTLALALAAVAVAQERPHAVREGQAPERATADRPANRGETSADQSIAQGLAISNALEVQLATLAAAETKNEKVKALAEKFVQDHTKALSQLEQFGAKRIDLARGSEPGGNVEQRRTAREADEPAAQRDPVRGEPAPGAAAPGEPGRDARDADPGRRFDSHRTAASGQPLNYEKIREQIAQKCLATAQKNWREKQGPDADMCFLGGQAVMHQQMIDAQEVLSQYASPQLQEVINQSIQTSQAHLKETEALLKTLMTSHGGAAAGQQPKKS